MNIYSKIDKVTTLLLLGKFRMPKTVCGFAWKTITAFFVLLSLIHALFILPEFLVAWTNTIWESDFGYLYLDAAEYFGNMNGYVFVLSILSLFIAGLVSLILAVVVYIVAPIAAFGGLVALIGIALSKIGKNHLSYVSEGVVCSLKQIGKGTKKVKCTKKINYE